MRIIAIKSFVTISLFGKNVPFAAPNRQIPITKLQVPNSIQAPKTS